MKKNKGNSLVQYIIILALIAGVVTPVYFTFGETIKNNFLAFLYMQQDNNVQITMNANNISTTNIQNGDIIAGQLGGSSGNPVRICDGGICAIDFGPIILNNIPENFTEIIETTGAHGTSESVLNLVQQVATQLEDNPTISEEHKEKIDSLIASGKQIIKIEEEFERKFDNFVQYKDRLIEYNQLMTKLWDKKTTNTISTEEFEAQRTTLTNTYKKDIDQYNKDIHGMSEITLNDQTYQISLWDNFVLLNPEATIDVKDNTLRALQDEYRFDLDSYEKYMSADSNLLDKDNLSPVGEYLKELKDILADDTVPPEIHKVTETLSKEIFDISQTVRQNIDNFGLHLTSYDPEYAYHRNLYDPSMGGDPRFSNQGSTIFDVVLNNNQRASDTTRLDLNIICTANTGQYNRQRDKCNGG